MEWIGRIHKRYKDPLVCEVASYAWFDFGIFGAETVQALWPKVMKVNHEGILHLHFFRHVSNRLAGYVKTVKNFTQVLVRNAGHMVPYDQPKWAFDMITRFTSGKKFQ